MATTTPENASAAYKAQIRAVAGENAFGEKMAVFGDSIPSYLFATAGAYDWRGFPLIANVMLGSPFTFLDAAVSSDTTTLCLARIQADVIDNNVGWCLVTCGYNDISNGDLVASAPTGTQITYTGIIDNLRTIYQTLRASGIKVVATTIYPTTELDEATSASALMREALGRINEWIRRYSSLATGVFLADFEKAMTDPATNIVRVGYTTAGDPVHPSYTGAQACGRAIYEAIQNAVPRADASSSWGLDPTNLIGVIGNAGKGSGGSGSNGVLLDTNCSGTFPYGWSTLDRNTGGAVCSATTGTDWRKTTFGKCVTSFTADQDGVRVRIGGDATAGLGRRDQRWTAGAAETYGRVIKPSGADNGYHYFLLDYAGTGTTGTTEPTWPTQVGEIVVDNAGANQIRWICTKTPASGDELYALCDIKVSNLSGNASVGVKLQHYNLGTPDVSAQSGSYDITATPGNIGDPPDWWPADKMVFRTPTLTLPAGITTRYLYVEIGIYGYAGDSVDVEIGNVGIYNVTNGSTL